MVSFAIQMAPIFALTSAVLFLLDERQVTQNFRVRNNLVQSHAWNTHDAYHGGHAYRYDLLEHWTTSFPILHVGANIPVAWERTINGVASFLRPLTALGTSRTSRVLTLPTAGISFPFTPGDITLVRSHTLPFTLDGDRDVNQAYTFEDGRVLLAAEFNAEMRDPNDPDIIIDKGVHTLKANLDRFAVAEEKPSLESAGVRPGDLQWLRYDPHPPIRTL